MIRAARHLDDYRLPSLSLAPLVGRLDGVGIIEHSIGSVPAPEFGHCTDDAGRALGLACSLPDDPDAERVAEACLRQLEASQGDDGRFVLRLDAGGQPTEDPPSDDSQARALWGLAVAAARPPSTPIRDRSHLLLICAATFESSHPRAAAHAVIAGEFLLRSDPKSVIGHQLVEANRHAIPWPVRSDGWCWPEARLTYGNGLLIEALLVLGEFARDDDRIEQALALLSWLVDTEWDPGGHFSFTPHTGRGPGETTRFDQQPIEAWTLASACAQAGRLTDDPLWTEVCAAIADWFAGYNDREVPVWDLATGAAFDALTETGVNLNQGTESTLAMIGAMLSYEQVRAGLQAHRASSSSR